MAPQQRQWRGLLQKWTNRSTYSAGAESNRAGVRAGAHPVSIRTHSRRASGVDPDLANGSAKLSGREERRQWIAVWVGLGIVTFLAIHRLRDFPYHLNWYAALAGIRS